MAFDYSKLRGRIIEKFGSQSNFAEAFGCSERTLSMKMTGKVSWKQSEMIRVLSLLGLSDEDVQDYFFNFEVQNV